jgi:starch phosphorylase
MSAIEDTFAPASARPSIAYFSMEIGLAPEMPTYSGGLGVLAADTIRAAADMRVPMVAVTLLHRKGYFHQILDANGCQSEAPVEWAINEFLQRSDARARVSVEGREVHLAAWRYEVVGSTGFTVPVYFLDADLPENSPWDRTLTHFLYGQDAHYRLCQEVILGIGGVRMLSQLGYDRVRRFHMNEGHASLLALELLEVQARRAGRPVPNSDDIAAVRHQCIFTTHTPVPAGHDRFPLDLVHRVLGDHQAFAMTDVFCCEGEVNMTYLALNLSNYVNGVAKRHGEVSQHMFTRYTIDSITNGVHAARWTSPPFQQLFDRHIPGWREDNFSLRYALKIPDNDVWQAHRSAKNELLLFVNRSTNAGMDAEVLTLGFARRMTGYKRPDLLLRNLDRLRHIARQAGAVQIIFAGKAHPQDRIGKEIIQRIFAARDALRGDIRIAYLEDYGLIAAKLLTAGVDVWLNTPQPPLEASGTSGMKAALNGVPSLSVLDGWWIEGCIEGVTGWTIDDGAFLEIIAGDDGRAEESLYAKLQQIIVPMFYHHQDRFIEVMRHAIALNGSFFNTQRMMQQYIVKAYFESDASVPTQSQMAYDRS